MAQYEGRISSEVEKDAIIRKSPVDGMKIGALKAGKSIKGDQLTTASDGKLWMHIFDPMKGWVSEESLEYSEITSPTPSDTPVQPRDIETPTPSIETEGSPVATSNIYRVRKWGDPIMSKYSFTLLDFPNSLGSNFQAVPLYGDDGEGGGIMVFVLIPHDDVMKIRDMQFAQSDGTVEQKMNWLAGKFRGRPYMLEDEGDNWKSAEQIRRQAIVYGGQLVNVIDRREIKAKLPNMGRVNVRMCRVNTFKRADFGKVSHNTHPHLVQQASSVYRSPDNANNYNPTPNGWTIFDIIPDPGDFKPKGSTTSAWWIPEEWLET